MEYKLQRLGNSKDYQVYGEVNGVILYTIITHFNNPVIYRYVIEITFFIGSKQFKVTSEGCTSCIDVDTKRKEIEAKLRDRIDSIIVKSL